MSTCAPHGTVVIAIIYNVLSEVLNDGAVPAITAPPWQHTAIFSSYVTVMMHSCGTGDQAPAVHGFIAGGMWDALHWQVTRWGTVTVTSCASQLINAHRLGNTGAVRASMH